MVLAVLHLVYISIFVKSLWSLESGHRKSCISKLVGGIKFQAVVDFEAVVGKNGKAARSISWICEALPIRTVGELVDGLDRVLLQDYSATAGLLPRK